NVEISVDPSYEGDIEVDVDGSAGVEGSVVVAEAVQAVDVSTDSIPNVGIGLTNQEAASFTLTEKTAEALEDDGSVELLLPEGAKFNGTPKVEVVDGDLDISDIKLSDDDRAVVFTVDSESTDASEIKV